MFMYMVSGTPPVRSRRSVSPFRNGGQHYVVHDKSAPVGYQPTDALDRRHRRPRLGFLPIPSIGRCCRSVPLKGAAHACPNNRPQSWSAFSGAVCVLADGCRSRPQLDVRFRPVEMQWRCRRAKRALRPRLGARHGRAEQAHSPGLDRRLRVECAVLAEAQIVAPRIDDVERALAPWPRNHRAGWFAVDLIRREHAQLLRARVHGVDVVDGEVQ